MKLICDLDDLPQDLRGGSVTIGNFDGVHCGHARIIERLCARATEVGGPSVVFTFDPHPVRLLRPDVAPPPLTWTKRKAALLAELGVDAMIAYPTDEALLSLSPRDFFDEVVCRRLQSRAIVEGPNFFFGHNRAGNISMLETYCLAEHLTLEIVLPVKEGDDYISSSRVRQAIAAGDIDWASNALTEPYRIRGMVTHGSARGSRIGFPTANLDAVDTLIPGTGVYAGQAYWNARPWPAAIHIGPNPTFGEDVRKVEVHLIGFNGNLYGEALEVDFVARIREVRQFKYVEDLIAQLNRDVAEAKERLGAP